MSRTVLTFVVTTADHAIFRSTVDAALAQTTGHRLIIVDASQHGVLSQFSRDYPQCNIIEAPGARNFGKALNEALTDPTVAPFATASTYLWFLHADSIPEPNSLEELLVAVESGSTVAIAGPKHLGPHGELLEVGITATATGVRLETAAEGEIDQGQYDGRVDVLGVGSAGMLIRRDVWEESGGFDPVLGPFGDGLELCRLVRRMGYRVVVAPNARITHLRQSLDQSLKSLRRQRHSAMYTTAATAPLWLALLAFPLYVLSQPVRSLFALMQGRFTQASAELLALLSVIADSAYIVIRRIQHTRRARVPHRAIASLEVPVRDLYNRRRWESQRVEKVSGLSLAPQYAAAIRHFRGKNRLAFGALIGGLSIAALLLFGPMMWAPSTGRLIGPGWADLPATFAALWQQAWLWPHALPIPPDPLASLLSILCAPAALVGITPVQILPWLHFSLLPLAGASAWVCSRAFTTRVGMRLSAAVLWVSQPAFLMSLFHGQLASSLIHSVLPLAVAALMAMCTARPQPELGIAFGTLKVTQQSRLTPWGPASLTIVILCCAMPGLWALWLCAAIVGTLVILRTKRASERWRSFGLVWTTGLPALIVIGPYAWECVKHRAWLSFFTPGGPALTGAGLAQGSVRSPDLLSGLPAPLWTNTMNEASAATPMWWVILCAVVLPWGLLVAGVLARMLWHGYSLLRGRTSGGREPIGLAIAAVGICGGLLVLQWMARIERDPLTPLWEELIPASQALAHGAASSRPAAFDDLSISSQQFLDAHQLVSIWLAPLVSLLACALLVVFLTSRPTERLRPILHAGSLVVAVAALLAGIIPGITGHAVPRPLIPLYASTAYSLPASTIRELHSTHQEALMVIPTERMIIVNSMRDSGRLLTHNSPLERAITFGQTDTASLSSAEEDTLTNLVTVLKTPDMQAAEKLRAAGVDSLVLPRLSTPEAELAALTLNTAPGIEPGASTAALDVWRIRPSEGDYAPTISNGRGQLWAWVAAAAVALAVAACGIIRTRRTLTVDAQIAPTNTTPEDTAPEDSVPEYIVLEDTTTEGFDSDDTHADNPSQEEQQEEKP